MIDTDKINEFENIIGYTFKDRALLTQALMHSSYAYERGIDKIKCNERIEFLGDAVLELVTSVNLYSSFPDMTEGEMTKFRASVVCESSLSSVARKLKIGEYLLMSGGEEAMGGRDKSSILADAFESVLGAMFLDAGFDRAKEFALSYLKDTMDLNSPQRNIDYKTQLQEIIQKTSKTPVEYRIVSERGAAHDREFVANVVYLSEILGTGTGKSKKAAEQAAARMALEKVTR